MQDSRVFWSAHHIAETEWKTGSKFGVGIHIETSSNILFDNCTSTMSGDGCFNLRNLNNATFNNCKSGDFNGFTIYNGITIKLIDCLSIKGGTGISCSGTTDLIIDNYIAQGCTYSIALTRASKIILNECNLISDWPQSVGIRVDNCTEGTFRNCKIKEHQWGILVRTSDNISINEAKVVNGGAGLPPGGGGGTGTVGPIYGIDIGAYSTNTHVRDCDVDGSHYAIAIRNSMVNCTIYNTTISNTNYSALYLSSSKCDAQTLAITNSNQTAVQSYGSVLNITNSSISTSNLFDFYLDMNSNITTLNTTFNKVRVQYIDNDSTLTVRWFMHVHVIWPDLMPIADASVEVRDANDNIISTGVSDINGTNQWIKCTEYFRTPLTTTYYTPYNVSASKWALHGWAVPEAKMERSSDVYVVLGGYGYNIFLHEGWNLVSIPYQPYYNNSTNIAVVLKSIEGRLESVRWYNTTDFADPWKIYRPGSTVNDLNHLDHRMGVWVSVTGPCTLVATGDPQTSTPITLNAGWNLIGYPARDDSVYTVGNLKAATGTDHVEGFDSTSPSMLRVLEDSYILKCGEGYWVYVDTTVTWTVNW
jgi:parallel beta-helix repeat protein